MAANRHGPTEAAIVGAGPSGTALAIRLAKAGARWRLIDAGRFPRDKLCGEYLSPEGVAAVERLGLADALARSGGRPIRAVRLTTPGGRSLRAEVAGPDGRAGLGLSRAALDAILLDGRPRPGRRPPSRGPASRGRSSRGAASSASRPGA